MGVPKDKYDTIKGQLAKALEEVNSLKEDLGHRKAFMKEKDRVIKEQSSELEITKASLKESDDNFQKLSKEVV
eukprot:CAMPEP_0170490676 /NCGR_PEP_ID=MMETSP0208-20121228/8794_1 /TAXON_ID=197538 /ORGANISM="Strombidium inclinatum, Strain S3" /LENGTH=72 /DNA_ID=CAMNT_0010766117 /DNA_START=1186 /DNA_END=1404 /DNA_ORIENTATION=+